MLLSFVLPAQRPLVSGGNLYNDYLATALADMVPVRQMDATEWLANSGRDSADDADTWYLVDSLCLPAIDDYLATRDEPGRIALIAHLLPSHDPAGASVQSLALERRVLDAIAVVVATSAFTGAALRARGLPDTRIITVPPAASFTPSGPPARAIPGADNARILLVGNLVPIKGALEFLRTYAAQVRASDDFCIDIVGPMDIDPDYARACTAFAQARPALATRVHFHGPVAHEDMPGFYRRAAIFVSCSRVETFGMALQEARRMGVPVLVRRGGHAATHVTSPEVGAVYDDMDDLVAGLLGCLRAPQRLRDLAYSAYRARLDSDYSWAQAARTLIARLRAMAV